MDLNHLSNLPSTSTSQNFVNHLTPETFLNANTAPEGLPPSTVNETSMKRKPGRPKGSGKKDSNSTTPPTANGIKRPVGRPRKDGLPAGSAGPSRAKRNGLSDASDVPSLSTSMNQSRYSNGTEAQHGDRSTKHSSRSTNFPFNDWAELARSKPTMFLTTLLVSLASLPPLQSTSTLTVEEAFKSHLVSLSPSPSQAHHIPSLYSILKTFWLPSSPAYFSLTASTSTARTPSDHRFLYWDPQPLVFNGISCPNCSSPLLNQGRIKSGPIKVYDIERPFFIIGCEYVCKSAVCTNGTGEPRKYSSTDPSILRSLPTKLKDEFPARLIGENDSGSSPDVWNWQALGVSKLLWNLVGGALKAGLQKDGIIDLLWTVQRGLPGEEDKKSDDHEDTNHTGSMTNGNGQSTGSYARTVQQSSGGFPDAYNNAWRANTAVVESRDGNRTADVTVVPSSAPSTTSPSTQPTGSVYTQQASYGSSVYSHAPNFGSYQFNSHDFQSAASSPRLRPSTGVTSKPANSSLSTVRPSTVVTPTSGTATPTPPIGTIAALVNGNSTLNGTNSHNPHNPHTSHASTSNSIRPASTELGKRPYPFTHQSDNTDFHPGSSNQMTVLSGESPRKRSPRHCSKCGSPDCKGKGGRNFCMNPCKDCGKLECRGRNSRRPDKPCTEGWPDN
ncbi:hypothetical protein E1B28_001514 [Marasmius oreades]|uniref:Uncharacterized protein n=1 Tax=Marasmius oreades TaxID=181124 RepID=A0A9P7V3P9_9AGAR|nr:uncharacterized protein E1B28_001514 [Marasmius oreades]KAG7099692.1 hypothetical protein E1B28_001514 [Marasmius oreades]